MGVAATLPEFSEWTLQPLLREQGEILLIIPNKYCRRNAGCPMHSSPHRKFQKCAARVLIRPGTTYPERAWELNNYRGKLHCVSVLEHRM